MERKKERKTRKTIDEHMQDVNPLTNKYTQTKIMEQIQEFIYSHYKQNNKFYTLVNYLCNLGYDKDELVNECWLYWYARDEKSYAENLNKDKYPIEPALITSCCWTLSHLLSKELLHQRNRIDMKDEDSIISDDISLEIMVIKLIEVALNIFSYIELQYLFGHTHKVDKALTMEEAAKLAGVSLRTFKEKYKNNLKIFTNKIKELDIIRKKSENK